jgi:hypothetical protein
MSHSHVVQIINTDPENLKFEKITMNTFAITCVSLKSNTVTCKTSTDTFIFTRPNSQIASALYEDFANKIILVHKFDQDGQKSDVYNNLEV